MSDVVKEIIKLLDEFGYELNDYVCDNKYLIVDNHIELAKHLVANGVAVQKRGHWIEYCTSIVCSECETAYSDEIVLMSRDFECDKLNYCPRCGAQMEVTEVSK